MIYTKHHKLGEIIEDGTIIDIRTIKRPVYLKKSFLKRYEGDKMYRVKRPDGTTFHVSSGKSSPMRVQRHPQYIEGTPFEFVQSKYSGWYGLVVYVDSDLSSIVLVLYDRSWNKARYRRVKRVYNYKLVEPFDISWVNPDWYKIDINHRWKIR